MKKNNQGVSPLYIIIGVVALVSIIVGGYYFYKSQKRKEYISKIEKLDKEIEDLIDSDNYFTIVNGEAVPKTQSSIKSNLDKIEDNLKEYDKTLKLINTDGKEIFCIVDRNTGLESKFVDGAKRNLIGSGSSSTQYNRNFFAKNFEDDVVDWKSKFKRGCKDLYEENGIEFND